MRKPKPFLPQRKTKHELFVVLFQYWATKFGVPGLEITRDNRYTGHVVTETYDDGSVRLVYNARRLGKWSDALVVCAVFHELAHVFKDLDYETEKQQIKSEYEAESFALHMLKCFYPQFVKENVDYVRKKMKLSQWRRMYPIHYKAFLKIPDYQPKGVVIF